MTIFEYYAALKCHPDNTDLEIKQQHRTLSRKYHPDRMGGDSAVFTQVQQAFTNIRDGKARATLRTKLKGLGDVCPDCKGNGYTVAKKGFVVIGPKVACGTCLHCGYLPRS